MTDGGFSTEEGTTQYSVFVSLCFVADLAGPRGCRSGRERPFLVQVVIG